MAKVKSSKAVAVAAAPAVAAEPTNAQIMAMLGALQAENAALKAGAVSKGLGAAEDLPLSSVEVQPLDDGSTAVIIPAEGTKTDKGFTQYLNEPKGLVVKHNGVWCWLNIKVTSLGDNGMKVAKAQATVQS